MNTSMPLSTEMQELLDDSSLNPWSRFAFIAFGLFGAVDNAFVLIMIGYVKSLQNPTNLLVANQSLIDMTTSLLLLALTITPVDLFLIHPNLAKFVCIFWLSWYPFWATTLASSANLLMITFERFCAVVSPIRYRQRMTKRRIALLSAIPWIYGLVATVNNLIFTRIDGRECKLRYPNKHVRSTLHILLFGLHFVCLIVTISALYIAIVVHLRREGRHFGGKTGMVNLRERARRNVLRTMFIVFICYIICWAPNDIFVLNRSFSGDGGFQGPVYDITVLMAFGNVWINPVIYSFRYETFQKSFLEMFCCKKWQGRKNSNISIYEK